MEQFVSDVVFFCYLVKINIIIMGIMKTVAKLLTFDKIYNLTESVHVVMYVWVPSPCLRIISGNGY